MKLRYLFSMILASVLLLAGCAQEEYSTSFDNIKLDKTYLVIPEEGGSVELKVNATESWAFDTLYTKDVWPNVITRKKDDAGQYYVSKVEASWLSVDKLSTDAGSTTLTFSADAVSGGREIELCIKAGVNSQFVRVRQGSLESVSATCADVIAGPDGKTYKVKGTVTSIANTTYGNWYLNDGTGEVYVYGTLDKDGKTKNFTSLGLEVGDIVEVEGPKTTYGTTVELVDVMVLSIQKSLVKVITEEKTLEPEGGEFAVKLAFKGDGLYPEVDAEAKSWLSLVGVKTYAGTATKIEPNPADTAIVTVSVAPNAEFVSRKGGITFSSASGKNKSELVYTVSQKGNVPPTTPTIAEVRAATKGDEVTTEGKVMAVHQKGYIISDATGSIYVYTNAAPEVAVGNTVKVTGTFDNYYGTLQIKNPTVTANDKATNVVYPAAIDLTDQAAYDAFATFTADNPTDFAYVKIKGVLSGSYNNTITVGTSTKTAQFDYSNGDYAALNGKTVVVKAYIKGFHSKGYYQLMEVSVAEEGNEPDEPVAPVVKTLTNAEICAAMTSSETSYQNYTIESASGTWTVNASKNKDNTFLQCRGKKGAYIKTPAFEKDIKSVTIHFSTAKSVYANNVYCVFPSTWTAPTADAAYPEDGNVGRAVTDKSQSLTIPVEAGNKQVSISIIGTYAYYLDHIDVEF